MPSVLKILFNPRRSSTSDHRLEFKWIGDLFRCHWWLLLKTIVLKKFNDTLWLLQQQCYFVRYDDCFFVCYKMNLIVSLTHTLERKRGKRKTVFKRFVVFWFKWTLDRIRSHQLLLMMIPLNFGHRRATSHFSLSHSHHSSPSLSPAFLKSCLKKALCLSSTHTLSHTHMDSSLYDIHTPYLSFLR